jgi:hypothetical protein
VLIAANTADERATTAHRAKLAYVYVRQSSLNQVKQHQESTELQYRLVERAVALGWPHERVQVIDEDLGKSGAGSVERHGFQKLIARSASVMPAWWSASTLHVSPATIAIGTSCLSSARCSQF